MGTKGIEIVKMDVNELLNLLNEAFSDEWLAYYQYWLGAKIVEGPMKECQMLYNDLGNASGEKFTPPRLPFERGGEGNRQY